jgi:glucosamine kinase
MTAQRVELYVGVDAGGTGTRAALATATGELLAIGQGGPSDHLGGAAGRRRLERALAQAITPLLPHIGSAPCAVHAGVRGLSIPGRSEATRNALARLLPTARAIDISTDAAIAQWGGLGGGEGVAVLSGTGSVALARGNDGRAARAGGYGYLVGDEGSGFWLGREAIAASLRALDGRGPPTQLADLIRDHTRQSSLPAVVGWVYERGAHVPRIAHLAPLVSRAAEAGDEVAQGILARAGLALAELAAYAARGVWTTNIPPILRVARCGGVWSAGAYLMTPFDTALASLLPTGRADLPLLPPVGGALLLAMGRRDQLDALVPAFAHTRR